MSSSWSAVAPGSERVTDRFPSGARGSWIELLPRISEAYIKGRTDGADIFAEQVNRALAARGIRVAIAVQHATVHLLDD
jgi:hypothetical protein